MGLNEVRSNFTADLIVSKNSYFYFTIKQKILLLGVTNGNS